MVNLNILLLIFFILTSISFNVQANERAINGGIYAGILVGESDEDGLIDSGAAEIGLKINERGSYRGGSASFITMELQDTQYNGFQISTNLNTNSTPVLASLGVGLILASVTDNNECEDNCDSDDLALGIYPELSIQFNLFPQIMFGFYARKYFIESLSEEVKGIYIGVNF
ncbi:MULTISPECIES: hypothetical protein [Marinomonas]|uniref:Outer membrane protein beta-barrel domain-containing protein n=1 Tax=Marinomonas rhodophyticola TaxID=2992803 RepID=A0ABT3KKY4_9GAMM|nr:hypothetical protein [Marinomonas sp. KJ51-3]MCW4631069.1 hypothetical protein [Marinomonas sp. KJ51-3]